MKKKRYEVGYSRVVAGAVGDSPKEWYCHLDTNDLVFAKITLARLIDVQPKAIIFDSQESCIIQP